MNKKDIVFGLFWGFMCGIGLCLGIYLANYTKGEKIETVQCLNENPQICRDITIFYTEYKQHGEIQFNAHVEDMLK